MAEKWSEEHKKKLVPIENQEEWANSIRKANKTIATVNGSFDLLHAGHLQILYEASTLADVLIVALNSDASIKQYKCVTRPIISLEYRLQMIAAIEFVTYVTWFEETDPCMVLKRIRPEVHVNGIEYKDHCIEEKLVLSLGGKVHYVSPVPGLSTSKILQKAIESISLTKVSS